MPFLIRQDTVAIERSFTENSFFLDHTCPNNTSSFSLVNVGANHVMHLYLLFVSSFYKAPTISCGLYNSSKYATSSCVKDKSIALVACKK